MASGVYLNKASSLITDTVVVILSPHNLWTLTSYRATKELLQVTNELLGCFVFFVILQFILNL